MYALLDQNDTLITEQELTWLRVRVFTNDTLYLLKQPSLAGRVCSKTAIKHI